LADDRGRPVAFALTPGNVADVVMAIPLLAAVAKPKRLLADKAYDADSLRRWLKHRKIRAAIPSAASRRTHTPSIAPRISAETSSNACSASYRIGDASQLDTTDSLETISPASLSPLSSSPGPN
jgi:transposase